MTIVFYNQREVQNTTNQNATSFKQILQYNYS